MKTEKLTKEAIEKADATKVETKTTIDKPKSKMPRKQKKKHNSALAAAAQARSATSNVGAHAFRDVGFAQSGTNLAYREEDGIL
jgi:hypothetical protein